MKDVIKTNCSY